MSSAVLFWVLAAVLLFWSLGAYNRLVRLRAQVIAAFAPVDHRLGQALELLPQAAISPETAAPVAGQESGSVVFAPAFQAALAAAAAQLVLSLHAARRHPLDAQAIAALKTAYATTQAVWQSQQVEPQVPASSIDPVVAQRAWEDNTHVVREAMESYNQSVLTYNAAIAQFPALLLAHLFSFVPAACL